MYRKTYVEIDCETLENNIKDIKSKYNDYDYYIGVVKANCYSHGFESVKYLIKGGINFLAVSSLEEALKVKKYAGEVPILVLEPIHYDDCLVAARHDIRVTIDNKELFNKLKKEKVTIKFHLKVDTGMNRFGFKSAEDIKYVCENADKYVFLEGLYTQLSSGVGSQFEKEKMVFTKLTSLIDLKKIPIVHIDRSLTLEQHERLPYGNGVRLGISMYGFKKQQASLSWKRRLYNKVFGKKNTFVPSILNVQTAFKFYTEVIEIKKVNPGEIVGYKGMYDARENLTIAILPYGFADYGFISTSRVCINDKFYKIATNYMDVTAVIVDDNVKLWDKVEIFGDKISIREASQTAGVNAYKNLCSVTNRVPRVYKYKDKIKEVEN